MPGGVVAGISSSVAQGLAFSGVISQEDADGFEAMLDSFLPTDPGDALVASVADVAGQFVAPAGVGIKILMAAGASPLIAALVADGLVGLGGVSPTEKTLAEFIPEDSETFSALRKLLVPDLEDSELENRGRQVVNAIVGLGIGQVAASLFVGSIILAKRFGERVAANPHAQKVGDFFKKFAQDESGAGVS